MKFTIEDQLEYHTRLEHLENSATSTKQFLISSYKKNLYPGLKAETHQGLLGDQTHSNLKLLHKSKLKRVGNLLFYHPKEITYINE